MLGVDGEATSDNANVLQFADTGTPDHPWMLQPADTRGEISIGIVAPSGTVAPGEVTLARDIAARVAYVTRPLKMPRTSTRTARTPSPSNARKSRRPVTPPVVVKDSPIQGSGVFATRTIAKGERIMEYAGERISHDEADRRYDDEAMERHHTFLFTLNEDTCIDGGVGGNESRFINHSCAPNAWSSSDGKRIFIIAGRAIAAGDEVLYDYSYTLDPGDTLEKLRQTYPCRCGAPNCRGTLAEMPKEAGAAKKKTAVARKTTPAKSKSSPATREAVRAGKKKSLARKKAARR